MMTEKKRNFFFPSSLSVVVLYQSLALFFTCACVSQKTPPLEKEQQTILHFFKMQDRRANPTKHLFFLLLLFPPFLFSLPLFAFTAFWGERERGSRGEREADKRKRGVFWWKCFPCTIVTWLILPVVICLSQRLSHACLSISFYTVKLRMAH